MSMTGDAARELEVLNRDRLKVKLAGLVGDCTRVGMWKVSPKLLRIISELEMEEHPEKKDASPLRDSLTSVSDCAAEPPPPDTKNWHTLVGKRLLVKASYRTVLNLPYETTLHEISPSGLYGKFNGEPGGWELLAEMTVVEILPTRKPCD